MYIYTHTHTYTCTDTQPGFPCTRISAHDGTLCSNLHSADPCPLTYIFNSHTHRHTHRHTLTHTHPHTRPHTHYEYVYIGMSLVLTALCAVIPKSLSAKNPCPLCRVVPLFALGTSLSASLHILHTRTHTHTYTHTCTHTQYEYMRVYRHFSSPVTKDKNRR